MKISLCTSSLGHLAQTAEKTPPRLIKRHEAKARAPRRSQTLPCKTAPCNKKIAAWSTANNPKGARYAGPKHCHAKNPQAKSGHQQKRVPPAIMETLTPHGSQLSTSLH